MRLALNTPCKHWPGLGPRAHRCCRHTLLDLGQGRPPNLQVTLLLPRGHGKPEGAAWL